MAHITVADFVDFLSAFAPPVLAEDWDNVGLLVGRRAQRVERVMTCLTITPASAAEAVAQRAQLIVAHHPLPFAALRRITDESTTGMILLNLIEQQVAIYSPHTAFDSATEGINQRLAVGLGLQSIAPLIPRQDGTGSGRAGIFSQPQPLSRVFERVKVLLNSAHLQVVGADDRLIGRVGIACGSGGDFLEPAITAGCDLLLTGEARFHTCLEAEAREIALLLAGHFATERFAVEQLAPLLKHQFPECQVWASQAESDPLRWV
jgi:dinuclear metal center YbgI/SA1388 family protein